MFEVNRKELNPYQKEHRPTKDKTRITSKYKPYP